MAGVCKLVANVSGELCILSSRALFNSCSIVQKRFFHIQPNLKMREDGILQQNTENDANSGVTNQKFGGGVTRVYEKTEDNKTVFEGKKIQSPRSKVLLNLDGPKDACPLCKLNMKIKYTDILIISQFVQEDGNIIPRQVTGLCYEQHRKMKELIHQAHRAGLMQSLRPNVYPEEYSQMSDYAWKKYNVYFTDAMDDY